VALLVRVFPSSMGSSIMISLKLVTGNGRIILSNLCKEYSRVVIYIVSITLS
jgi:hypothetical protein